MILLMISFDEFVDGNEDFCESRSLNEVDTIEEE